MSVVTTFFMFVAVGFVIGYAVARLRARRQQTDGGYYAAIRDLSAAAVVARERAREDLRQTLQRDRGTTS